MRGGNAITRAGSKELVLVTDGDSRAALAVTRSLGRSGYRVVVGEKRQPCLAGSSRHCSGAITYPDPAADEAGFVQAIDEAIRRLGVRALIPVADTATWLVAANRSRFDESCLVPIPPLASVEHAADKAWVTRCAQAIDIATPRTVFLEQGDKLNDRRAELTFPVVIKPNRSKTRVARGWASHRVSYAMTWETLVADVTRRDAREFPLLLQEHITGSGVGIFTCIDHGAPIAWFAHRRLREKPPSGGVSVLCESIAVPEAVRQQSQRLLEALSWQGVAMVEFKEDRRDGSWRLMEVNGRFWGSLQLAIDAGVDFPTLLLDAAFGRRAVKESEGFAAGIRSRWLWGDVDSLLITLKHGRGTNGLSATRTLLDFLKIWTPGLRYENPRLSDLKPWWHETKAWFGHALD